MHISRCRMTNVTLTNMLSLPFSLILEFAVVALVDGSLDRTCEKITIPLCQGIGYNMTYMPNQFHHDNQEDASLEVSQFWPLVEFQCSPVLRFYLCTMYAPICVPGFDVSLPPCRSICEQAKVDCESLMNKWGYLWPRSLNCNLLPEEGEAYCLN